MDEWLQCSAKALERQEWAMESTAFTEKSYLAKSRHDLMPTLFLLCFPLPPSSHLASPHICLDLALCSLLPLLYPPSLPNHAPIIPFLEGLAWVDALLTSPSLSASSYLRFPSWAANSLPPDPGCITSSFPRLLIIGHPKQHLPPPQHSSTPYLNHARHRVGTIHYFGYWIMR